MELNDKEIELKLCETYFSILSKTFVYNITLDELCLASKIPYEKAEKIIPANFIESFFFLKLFISKVDSEVLDELENEIKDLSSSSHALENFARYNLGLVKKDETFVQVIKK